ncbi:MAG: hypothetical protein WAT39_17185, partial [Planctomycetota bacterium]
MTPNQRGDADSLLAAMAERLGHVGRLPAEVQRARREFFRADNAPAAASPPAAERRFHEWFLLERESEVLGAVPSEVSPFLALAQDLPESQAGVFVVQRVTDAAIDARDLQDDTSLDLVAPPAALRVGDLLVGRLWAEAAGRWRPSTALAVFRPGGELAKAIARDLQRLQLDRRLQQVELEHLLLQRARGEAGQPVAVRTVPLEHLEADLDRLLHAGGGTLQASDLSQQLARAERPGPVIGPVLDQLAFDTAIDLDRARALLVEIWNAHHADDEPAAGTAAPDAAGDAPGETLGERLVRELDEGLAKKRDVGELFAQLERMAGIEPDAEDDSLPFGDAPAAADPGAADDEDAEAGDDDVDESEDDSDREPGDADDAPGAGGGDLGPLVEEYLWESGQGDSAAAAPLRLFAQLQQNTPLPHQDLEQVTTADVLRLLLHVYLGSAPAERAASVRAAYGSLRGFFDWAAAENEIAVGGALAGCEGALLDQLDRLQAAGLGLSTPNAGTLRPSIAQIDDLRADGFGVLDDDGVDHWLAAPAGVLQHL